MTPGERTLRARIGAYSLHALRDPRETTRAARIAAAKRFYLQVDPEGVLPEAERARRAEAARRAYFAQLALKSAQTRSRRGKKTAGHRGNGAGQEVQRAGAVPH